MHLKSNLDLIISDVNTDHFYGCQILLDQINFWQLYNMIIKVVIYAYFCLNRHFLLNFAKMDIICLILFQFVLEK